MPNTNERDAQPWRVGRYWSSSKPEKQVLCLSVGEKAIAADGNHKDFIRWESATAPNAGAPLAEELSTCNCRWRGDAVVQQCTLHAAWKETLHERGVEVRDLRSRLGLTLGAPAAVVQLVEELSQPWYDLAWKHGAAQHISFAGDELEAITFAPGQFESFCAALAAAPAQQAGAPLPLAPSEADGSTPGPWRVEKRERDGEIVACWVAAPDCNGFAYAAEILGDDEYRDGEEAKAEGMSRRLADCELIVKAVAAHRSAPQQATLPAGEPDMRAVCEALSFDPTNHHNAAKCPYCRPTDATRAQPQADAAEPVASCPRHPKGVISNMDGSRYCGYCDWKAQAPGARGEQA